MADHKSEPCIPKGKEIYKHYNILEPCNTAQMHARSLIGAGNKLMADHKSEPFIPKGKEIYAVYIHI